METDPTRALVWMIGLPEITFLGVEDGLKGEARIHVETNATRMGCPSCGAIASLKDRSRVELVDLALQGRAARLIWHKRRWECTDVDCSMGTWTEADDRIAASRQVLTSRAGRWATIQVGRYARSVNEVAHELGCDWHTLNDTVVAYGEALLEADADRFGEVAALGLDEVLMVRLGPYHRQHFSTQIVDVEPRPALRHRPWSRAVPSPWSGWPSKDRRSGMPSTTAPSTSLVPTGGSSRSWFPTPPWWPTRFMSFATPTPSSTSAAGGFRTRPSGTGVASPIPSTGAGGS